MNKEQRSAITPGKWELEVKVSDGGGWKTPAQSVMVFAGEVIIASYQTDYSEYPSEEVNEANAILFAESGNVYNELGLTPRQLAEQRAELLEALRNSPCFCEDADGDDDAITCDRCAAIAKCGVKL